MKKSRLVMIGNGMAGVRALEELLKIAPELYDITVFGAESHPNYNRILLSPVLDFGWRFQPRHTPMRFVSELPSMAASAQAARRSRSTWR